MITYMLASTERKSARSIEFMKFRIKNMSKIELKKESKEANIRTPDLGTKIRGYSRNCPEKFITNR